MKININKVLHKAVSFEESIKEVKGALSQRKDRVATKTVTVYPKSL